MKKITQELIAQRSGVSRVAVSQVLNDSRNARISEEKKREILELAKSLRYQPRNVTTHTIGYVASFAQNVELSLLHSLGRAATQRGYRLALIQWDDDIEQMRRSLNAKTVDAAIFARWHDGAVKQVLPPEIPWLVIADEDDVDSDCDLIVADAAQATRVLAQHLVAQGYRRIALISGVESSFHTQVKAGYFSALKAAKLPRFPHQVLEVVHAHEIEKPLLALLRSKNPPDAILNLEATRAMAVVNLLQNAGYRLPKEMGLASLFHDGDFDWLRPRMTTTDLGNFKLSQAFIGRLLQRLADPFLAPQHSRLPAQLAPRESSVSQKTVRPL